MLHKEFLRCFVFAASLMACTGFSSNAQLPEYLPSEGLVGWWPFNGNANDESGNNLNGISTGVSLIEDRNGEQNSAFLFTTNGWSPGSQLSEIYIPYNNSLNISEISISTWIKTYDWGWPGSWAVIIARYEQGYSIPNGQAWALGLSKLSNPYNNGEFISSLIEQSQNHSSIIGNQVPINEWVNQIITFDGITQKQYLNGILTSQINVPNGFVLNQQGTSGISIGVSNQANGYWQPFNGIIDDIGIWNRALSEEEIQQLYFAEVTEGCTDVAACNFNPEASLDDGSCLFAQEFLDCLGNCLNDFDGDGICDELEVSGCTYAFACNYNPLATHDDGSCTVPETHFDCDGNCLLDFNNNGVCDLEEVPGCTSPEALNYSPEATLDDGSCIITCKGDFNNDGFIDVNDLLSFLAALGNYCSGAGCMDPLACNFDPEATFDLGYCQYPEQYYTCEGLPINDGDGDGIPDELEVAGCTDPEAVNYNALATDEDGTCQYGIQGEDHSCGASSVHNPELVYGTVTDIDGNSYRTIVIGNQEWMAENLNTSRYANGDLIPNITDDAQWEAQTQGAWCYYRNDIQYACPYGKLYNWYVTVDERNVCPTGWHVPSDLDWTQLTDFLGGENESGVKMKSMGSEHWLSPNTGATNESGFSGLPGGYRDDDGSFINVGYRGCWWSSSEGFNYDAWFRYLFYFNDNVTRLTNGKELGFSVRCLRD